MEIFLEEIKGLENLKSNVKLNFKYAIVFFMSTDIIFLYFWVMIVISERDLITIQADRCSRFVFIKCMVEIPGQ